MKRITLLVTLVVVGMLLVPAAGVLAEETETETEADNETVAPGERLGGVVGVQAAEFDGEIERNAFRIALERADDNATKASHIAEKLNESEDRLAELDERKATLQEQRERGEITEGQYRARTAKLATETRTVEHQLNQSNATAAGLPEETLRANGVNTTAIGMLQANAGELRGGEIAEIARSIAGDRSGMVERGPPGDRGPADHGPSENRTDDRGPSTDRPGDLDPDTDAADNESDDTENDVEANETDAEQQDTSDDEQSDDETDGTDDSGTQRENAGGGNAGNGGPQ